MQNTCYFEFCFFSPRKHLVLEPGVVWKAKASFFIFIHLIFIFTAPWTRTGSWDQVFLARTALPPEGPIFLTQTGPAVGNQLLRSHYVNKAEVSVDWHWIMTVLWCTPILLYIFALAILFLGRIWLTTRDGCKLWPFCQDLNCLFTFWSDVLLPTWTHMHADTRIVSFYFVRLSSPEVVLAESVSVDCSKHLRRLFTIWDCMRWGCCCCCFFFLQLWGFRIEVRLKPLGTDSISFCICCIFSVFQCWFSGAMLHPTHHKVCEAFLCTCLTPVFLLFLPWLVAYTLPCSQFAPSQVCCLTLQERCTNQWIFFCAVSLQISIGSEVEVDSVLLLWGLLQQSLQFFASPLLLSCRVASTCFCLRPPAQACAPSPSQLSQTDTLQMPLTVIVFFRWKTCTVWFPVVGWLHGADGRLHGPHANSTSIFPWMGWICGCWYEEGVQH